MLSRENQTFAATRPSSVLLEQVAVCVAKGEPVLLVGETGTGKTSTVQHLAGVTGELSSQPLRCLPNSFFLIPPPSCLLCSPGHRLRVVNMNQQSDTADLLGG